MGESNVVRVTGAKEIPGAECPTVVILSPVENQEVSGVEEVEVVTSDDGDIRRLEIHVDGSVMDTLVEPPFTVMWDTSRHSNGTHVLEAVASDRLGNKGTDTTHVTVSNSVFDDRPPSPAITAPIAGDSVSGVVRVWVYVTDDVSVQMVELYVNGILYQSMDCEGTECNLEFSWYTERTGKGRFTLQAVAVDSAGNRGESEEVILDVH